MLKNRELRLNFFKFLKLFPLVAICFLIFVFAKCFDCYLNNKTTLNKAVLLLVLFLKAEARGAL
jgi:hypothetical protein